MNWLGSSLRPGDRHAGVMSARSPGLREQVGEAFRLCHLVVAGPWSQPPPAVKDERVEPPYRPHLLSQ
jgi:hypothetical protein